jgi:hypothetical protein
LIDLLLQELNPLGPLLLLARTGPNDAQLSSIVSALGAAIPWHSKTLDQILNPIPSGGVLVSDVVYRISSVSDGPAIRNQRQAGSGANAFGGGEGGRFAAQVMPRTICTANGGPQPLLEVAAFVPTS